jgi:hypothetical protein
VISCSGEVECQQASQYACPFGSREVDRESTGMSVVSSQTATTATIECRVPPGYTPANWGPKGYLYKSQ